MSEVVIKVTMYTNGVGEVVDYATKQRPMWVIAKAYEGDDSENDGYGFEFDSEIVVLCPLKPAMVGEDCCLLNGQDRYEIPSCEEWPDEVCRVVALRAMGIEGED